LERVEFLQGGERSKVYSEMVGEYEMMNRGSRRRERESKRGEVGKKVETFKGRAV